MVLFKMSGPQKEKKKCSTAFSEIKEVSLDNKCKQMHSIHNKKKAASDFP